MKTTKNIWRLIGLFVMIFPQVKGQLPIDTGVYIIAPMTLSQSGNYYLNNDLRGTIIIAADNVTLDMNNKKIVPVSGNGISVTGHSAITIKNGIIQGATGDGILISTCNVVTINNVDFIGNTTGAYILTSTNVIVEQCNFTAQTASATPGSNAFAGALVIDNSNNCLVQNNEMVKNTNCFGILMHNGSHDNTLKNNICNQNQSGIYLHNGCFNNEIIGNICSENSVTNKDNSGSGIFLFSGCSHNVIQDNFCMANIANGSSSRGGSGIFVRTNSFTNHISGNRCGNHISGGVILGIGIVLFDNSGDNIIVFNQCFGNSVGILDDLSAISKIYENQSITNGINYFGPSNIQNQGAPITTGNWGDNFSG